jgi:hypothetical protein
VFLGVWFNFFKTITIPLQKPVKPLKTPAERPKNNRSNRFISTSDIMGKDIISQSLYFGIETLPPN